MVPRGFCLVWMGVWDFIHTLHKYTLRGNMLSSSHTRTFNVLMPVGLHLMTMQTQVPRISILHVV
ncbi:hypothetical protein MTR67_048102, partial [Solanum verrucosum]